MRPDSLVQRLREMHTAHPEGEAAICGEAADRIEGLEKTLAFREQRVRETILMLEALRTNNLDAARTIVGRMETTPP